MSALQCLQTYVPTAILTKSKTPETPVCAAWVNCFQEDLRKKCLLLSLSN